MKTSKIIGIVTIGYILLLVLARMLGYIGFRTGLFLLSPHLVFWISLMIHVVSATALFKDVKARQNRGIPTYLSLDALFWALVGLAFGLIGLLAHWFFNDYIRSHSHLVQPDSRDTNAVGAPGDTEAR